MNADDAERLKLTDGDEVEVASRRGTLRLPVKVGDILPGHLFVPFHYGYWDATDREPHRAANELTITGWDPVSKQPYFKYAAVQVRKARRSLAALGKRVADAASKAVDQGKELADKVLSAAHTPRSRVADAIGQVRAGCAEFAAALRDLKAVHFEETELVAGLETIARLLDEAAAGVGPAAGRYGEESANEPAALRAALFPVPRPGPPGVLRDLHAAAVMAAELRGSVVTLIQVARGLRDADLLAAATAAEEHAERAATWAQNHVKHRAVQTLIVPA
jgi:ferredoxin-nitrate reductase